MTCAHTLKQAQRKKNSEDPLKVVELFTSLFSYSAQKKFVFKLCVFMLLFSTSKCRVKSEKSDEKLFHSLLLFSIDWFDDLATIFLVYKKYAQV